MFWIRNLIGTLTLSVLLTATSAVGQERQRDAIPILTYYLELITSGNFDIASDMWTPEALERSHRFGISFSDIESKTDCSSPIIRRWGDYTAKSMTPVRKFSEMDEDTWCRLEYADVYGSTMLRHNYYAQRRGDWFWLSYPQDFYAANWAVVESKYLRVRIDPEVEKYVNEVGLAEADRFVETVAEQLGMASDRLDRIAEAKIEYFYCGSDSVVEQITGFLVKGTLDLASNDVISADFPHFHELAHLLVNIHLQDLPLYTLPVVREGLAVNLAGRWGKHPAVLMDLATALIDQELLIFDSTFTMRGFDTESGADIVYPVCGIFCGYLIDRLGMSEFLELYLGMSGKFGYLDGLSAEAIQNVITDATGHDDWAALKTDFDQYLKEYVDNRLTARPGLEDGGNELVSGDRFVVVETDDWIAFEFNGNTSEEPPEGNLVFAPVEELKEQASQLFESQYGATQAYEGYRFGVRFDRNEIGLYDYGTNLLVAKYIWGITPSDDYYDADRNVLTARFDKSLFLDLLPQNGQCQLLPL
jgi:hypothetical protein